MALPRHVGIIMDGNGRWAKERGLPRTAGHKKGAEILKDVLEHIKKKGIQYVTLFAFSSENWKRPQPEVDTLIDLFRTYLNRDIHLLQKEGVRIRFIGNRSKFPDDIVQKMTALEEETKDQTDFTLILALSYGAREDIALAAQNLARAAVAGEISPNQITPDVFASALSTKGLPEPDLIIRTSGEERISNFLLWEIAYAEFYFSPVFWPDFNAAELDHALDVYASRRRRFGGV